MRPGQNIEDVERRAIEHLVFGKDKEQSLPRQHVTPNNQEVRKGDSTYQTSSYRDPVKQDDYFIDPITNRKVAKHPPPNNSKDDTTIHVKTFKDDHRQSTIPNNTPNHTENDNYYDDTFSTEELRRYRRVGIDPNPTDIGAAVGGSRRSISTPESDDYLGSHGSSIEKNPNLWKDDTAESQVKYDDLEKYRPTMDGPISSAADSISLDSDLSKHKSPASNMRQQFHDLQPPYEDLDRYRSAVEDGLPPYQSDSAPVYHDLERYQAVKETETENKPTGYVEEPVAAEKLDEYESFVDKIKPSDFPSSTVEDLRRKYDRAEIKMYTTVKYLELDESAGQNGEALSKGHDSEELTRSKKPLEALEPNAKNGHTVKELEKNSEGLDAYKPVMWDEPDGKQPPSTEELSKHYNPEELAKYKPFYWNEPDGKPPPSAEELSLLERNNDLHKYQGPVLWNEPEGKVPPSNEELSHTKRRDDLGRYKGPILWNEPEGKTIPVGEEHVTLDSHVDLHKYGAVKMQEPNGQAPAASVQEGFADVDTKPDYRNLERLVSKDLESTDESDLDVLSKRREAQIARDVESSYRNLLERFRQGQERLSDEVDKEANIAVQAAREKAKHADVTERPLTGNYTRDFPEEFEKSWTQTLSSAPAETFETSYQNGFQSEDQNMDGGLEGAFGRPTPVRAQTALDRHSRKKAEDTEVRGQGDDPYSKEPQGLETSYTEECGGTSSQPVFLKQYGGLDRTKETDSASERHKPVADEKAGDVFETNCESATGTTLYRILAYDPATQKMDVAETTSLVADFTSSLRPADALVRLSHPTKFFPHFASLEEEGFEIISGNDDVLVFRKVLPSRTRHDDKIIGKSSTADTTNPNESPVNPIDMTGRPRMISPASANFASPTGYVAYPEYEAGDLPPPPPRVKYNIDLRREEPVFSGPKTERHSGQKQKKSSLGKRILVGGAWVAGISYGLGVVSEYFTTGGIDGLGPKGF